MTTPEIVALIDAHFAPVAATLACGAAYALWHRCRYLDREITRLWEALAEMQAKQTQAAIAARRARQDALKARRSALRSCRRQRDARADFAGMVGWVTGIERDVCKLHGWTVGRIRQIGRTMAAIRDEATCSGKGNGSDLEAAARDAEWWRRRVAKATPGGN